MNSRDAELGSTAGIGPLAHDEGLWIENRTTGVTRTAAQGPRADHNSIAQGSGGRRSSTRRPGQVPGHREGIARWRYRHYLKAQRARDLVRRIGNQSGVASFG